MNIKQAVEYYQTHDYTKTAIADHSSQTNPGQYTMLESVSQQGLLMSIQKILESENNPELTREALKFTLALSRTSGADRTAE